MLIWLMQASCELTKKCRLKSNSARFLSLFRQHRTHGLIGKIPSIFELSTTIPARFTCRTFVPKFVCRKIKRMLLFVTCFLNLAAHIYNKEINWSKLEESVRLAIRQLDNLIDINKLPIPEAEKSDKENRAIGLGIMGFRIRSNSLACHMTLSTLGILLIAFLNSLATWPLMKAPTCSNSRQL
jgi:hypothetical protein